MPPLHRAARDGDVHRVQQLLQVPGACVDEKDAEGCTALHYAADGNHVSVAEVLLHAGADVGTGDTQGDSPVQYAQLCEHQEVLAVLRRWRGGGEGKM